MTRLPTWPELMDLMRLTLRAPRDGAAEVLRIMPHRRALWLMLAFLVIMTVFLGEVVALLSDGPTLSPLVMVVLQGAAALLTVVLVYFMGRAFGGQGSFDGALALVTWIQFIFLFVQLAQVAVGLLVPSLTVLVVVAAIALYIWILASFLMELHGFTSMGAVILGIFAVMMLVGFVLLTLLGGLGLDAMIVGEAA